jgi:hypothetical protein
MCDIPLDLERKFEQRWAARFARPVDAARREKHQLEKQALAAPAKAKRKTCRVEPAESRPAPAV